MHIHRNLFLTAVFLAMIATANAASCVDEVTDYASTETCTKREIEPLNTKLSQLRAALDKQVAGTEAATPTAQANRAWDAYVNGQCTAEVMLFLQSGGSQSSPEFWRKQMRCAKRLIEARIRELEGM